MKKRLLSIFLTLCMLLPLLPTVALGASTAWNGTADTEWYNGTDTSFTLYTAEELAGLALLVNAGTDDFYGKIVSLGADIVLNTSLSETARQWTPIGTNSGNGFAGVFDGRGHTISGLYINNSAAHQALFGFISARHETTGGTLRNLGVVKGSVTCSSHAAGLVGKLYGSITNCYTDVSVTSTGNYAAGIVADNTGTIQNCYNIGSIQANTYAGGFVPQLTIGRVITCYGLQGSVGGANSNIGDYMNGKGYLVGFGFGTITGDNFDEEGALAGGGTLVDKLNAWVIDEESPDYYTWKTASGVNDGYPVQSLPLSVEQYAVTITVCMDGEAWDSGKTFTLKNNATAKVITDLAAVKPGTYSVLDAGADTGYDVTVEDADTEVALDYFTVSGRVSDYADGTNTVSGLQVTLYKASDTAFSSPLAAATTNENGDYALVAIAGSYVARVAGLPGVYGGGTADVTGSNEAVTGADITLTSIGLQSIAISSGSHKTVYQVGEPLDVTNLKITATMTDGSSSAVNVTTEMVTGFNSAAITASQTLTVTYQGKTATYTISVIKAIYKGTQASVPTEASKTETDITLTAQSISGETVEYAISNSITAPDSGWQTTTSFTGLTTGTYYYFFARVQETPAHGAGTAAVAWIRTNQGAFPDKLSISSGSITIENGSSSGIKVTYGGSFYDDLPADTQIVVEGTSFVNSITVYASCNITLNGVTISPGASRGVNAMNIIEGTVNLTLPDGKTNTLTSARETNFVSNYNNGKAALRVAPDAALIISGSTGKLTASGGNGYAKADGQSFGGGGAGIGGDGTSSSYDAGVSSGSITINGGVISATGGTASSYWGGAASGIGGGGGAFRATGGNSGAIVINGGFVTATGGAATTNGRGGPGIGGGGGGGDTKDLVTGDTPAASGTTGMIRITGGTVFATGGAKGYSDKSTYGCGIGTDADTGSILTIIGGSLKAVSGGEDAAAIGGNTPTNGISAVYKATFTVPGATNGAAVSLPVTGYGTKDIRTLDYNKVYLYLPAGPASILYGGDTYSATVTSDGTANFTKPTSFTATASMSGYTYGGMVSTPSVSTNPGSGAVTYCYSSENKNTGGTQWTSIGSTTLNAGDYYLYAVIAASGAYTECTTDAVKFTVSKADQATPAAPTVSGTPKSGSITISSDTGYAYFCQLAGSAAPTAEMPGWQQAAADTMTFSSLSPNQSYDIYTYRLGDVNYNNSPVSAKLTVNSAMAKVTEVTAPGDVTLVNYYTTAAAVIPELPGAAKATLEGGGTQYLNINWTAPSSYKTAPGAANTYSWSVSAPANYTFDTGVISSGSITVTNKAATPVTITATEEANKLTRTYAGATLNVTDLFSIDAHAGAATYSVAPGTGTGSITAAGVLTVTKAGTFTVEVDTAAVGNYAAGSQTATLTVDKGTGSGSVTIDDWTYGDTAETPVPTSGTNGIGSVTYTYEGTGETTYAASATAPGEAGSYKVTATFAATDLYNECTAEKAFTIDPQPVTKPLADETSFTYTGSEQTYTLTADSRYTITGNTRTDAGSQTVTAALDDKANYVWVGGGTDDLTFTFTIAKAPISFTVSGNRYTYDAGAHTAAVAQTASQTPVIDEAKYTVAYKLPADESATADKTAVGEYDIIVTLSDDNFCFSDESDPATRSHKAGTLTIASKTVTALWKNTTKVYTGSVLSPDLELVGLATEDADHVTARLTQSKTEAGTYTVTAELIGSEAANYTLTNPNGTFIIQKAPVTFMLSGDTVLHDGKIHTVTASSMPHVTNTITYRTAKGETVAEPTNAGSYTVYAEITNPNYRHADGTDGAARKIGMLTIYQSSAPKTYTVSFDANGGTGAAEPMAAVQAGTVRNLPSCGFANTGKTFVGWSYGGRTFKPGESLPQPSSNITLKAIWSDKVYVIGGTVQEGDPASAAANVVVTLMYGSEQIGSPVVTDTDGHFHFADVAPGVYNLVANKNGVTQTILVNVTVSDAADQVIVMPAGQLNSLVEVKAGSPAIVVGDLEKAFTQQDKDDAQTKTVELKLTAEAKAADSTDTTQQEIQKKAGSVNLFLDLTLTKTVDGVESTLDGSPVLLTAVITLPAELQGKDSYTVYRYHGTEVQTLTTTANAEGEKISVNKEKTVITVYTKNFSAYAIKGTTSSGGSGYTLTFEPNGGSKIASVSVSSGTTLDLSNYIPAREGYEFVGWYSDSALTKAVSSIMLTANVTVYAKWTEVSKNPFTDVASDDYFYDAVLWAVKKGITNGTTPTTFSPDVTSTRAQTVTFLWRAMGSPEPTSTSCPFTDVAKDAYYYKALLWAVEKGIAVGTSRTTFSPNDTVTRGQAVTFLWRTAGEPAATAANPFDDVSHDAYYESAVLWAVKNGITAGTGEGAFSPADGCTRAQIVTFLYRYLSK